MSESPEPLQEAADIARQRAYRLRIHARAHLRAALERAESGDNRAAAELAQKAADALGLAVGLADLERRLLARDHGP